MIYEELVAWYSDAPIKMVPKLQSTSIGENVG